MKLTLFLLLTMFVLTATAQDVRAEEEKYYKNWLGEKCIEFSDSVKPYYTWRRELSYAGVPLFLSSLLIKSEKKGFRSARFEFQDDFKSSLDNYTQYAPYGIIIGLKAAGYNGRSSWDRLLVSTALSNVLMANIVNVTKYSAHEMRPDNSSDNSFPSGHTATAFVAATILHKEYGLARSPWFSIGGYGIATATGVMRILNNRHWVSDVVAGAGIGILSTEVGYFFGDLIYRNKGICHRDLVAVRNREHPSFFDIQMGVGLHSGEINFRFDYDTEIPARDRIELGTSTAFGIETAYFINRYIGFGGMARITTTPARGLEFSDSQMSELNSLNNLLSDYSYVSPAAAPMPLPGIYNAYIDNANFVDASLDLGVYANIPVGDYFDLGARIMVGRRFSGGISYKAYNGTAKTIDGRPLVDEGNTVILNEPSTEYEIMRVRGGRSVNGVLGVSLTWHYKDNFSWKFFADFDCAKNDYTYTGRFFSRVALDKIGSSTFPSENPELWSRINHDYVAYNSRFMNFFTLGGAFTVNF